MAAIIRRGSRPAIRIATRALGEHLPKKTSTPNPQVRNIATNVMSQVDERHRKFPFNNLREMDRKFSEAQTQWRSLHHGKQAVILGNGNTSRAAILQLVERGYKVLVLTSCDHSRENTNSVIYHQIDRSRLTETKYLLEVIQRGMRQHDMLTKTRNLAALNLIGVPNASSVEKLRKINIEIPITFFEAVQEIGKDSERVSFGQVSSISTLINGPECEYANSKRDADARIQEIKDKNKPGSVVSLRTGLALPNPTKEGRVDSGHAYSPGQQILGGRVIAVLGNGKQTQQPLSQDELYEAFVNAFESEKDLYLVIPAVGSQVVTQEDLFKPFSPEARIVRIPYPFAHYIAQNAPIGRLQEYAVRLMENLEKNPDLNKPFSIEEFEELLGRKPKGYSDIYNSSQNYSGNEAPIFKHSLEVIGAIAKSPFQFISALYESIPSVKMKVTIGGNNPGIKSVKIENKKK